MAAPLKVLYHSAIVTLAVAALMAFILFVVPDGNDYALVALDKHARLEQTTQKKIVFVGGSNLAYGLDSETVEKALGYTVVNMGMNAFLGVRYMLGEVEAALKPGDVVVLAVENDAFHVQPAFDGVEGRPEDLLMMTKVRPAAFGQMPWATRKEVIAAIPGAVHHKAMRLINDGLRTLAGRAPKASLLDNLETRAGFNRYGDLVSHINVTWTGPRDEPMDLGKLPPNASVTQFLREHWERWRQRGIRVLLASPPVPAPYFEAQRAAITKIRTELERAMPGSAIAPFERYVFPDSCFFDDIHHLNGECRLKQSKMLTEDLAKALGLPLQSSLLR